MLLSGGVIWAAYLRYDLARSGRRRIRVLYMYSVMKLAGMTTVICATATSYELLRRLFGYRPPQGMWVFLVNQLPWLLPACLIWTAHWLILRMQSSIHGVQPAIPGEIAWPRRPALAVQSFAGLGMLVTGMLVTIWLAIDALCGTGAAHAGLFWWRERLSIGLAMTAIGLVLWLPAWLLLQRAAAAAPTQERQARSRRTLLNSVIIVSAVFAFGFAIAVFWLLFRALLGEGLDIVARAHVLQYLCTTMFTGTVAAVHSLVLREDLRWQPRRASSLHLTVLVEDGADDLLPVLAALPNVTTEVAGHLVETQFMPGQDFHALANYLSALSEHDRPESAVVVIGRAGCSLYSFRKDGAARP